MTVVYRIELTIEGIRGAEHVQVKRSEDLKAERLEVGLAFEALCRAAGLAFYDCMCCVALDQFERLVVVRLE